MATERELERQGLMSRRMFILGNFAAVGVLGALLAVPLGGFIGGAIGLKQSVVRRRIGPLSAFPVGVPTLARFTVPVAGSGITSQRPVAIYVVRTGTQLFVFYNGCTHMGCPVRWDPVQGLFECPCHGGIYNMLGEVVHGPPPYALRQLQYELIGGVLYVYGNVYD
jgi:menaquinol-cytochrome c reductase iron-sulfur subunit